MTSRYVVFQYLPDPATGECINFGVATDGPEGFYARFLRDWRRVKSFAGVDVKFLREFGQQLEESSADQPSLFAKSPDELAVFFDQAPDRWINTIQVTTPRASVKPSDQLVDDVARRFLRTTPRQRRGTSRLAVRSHAYESMIDALVNAGVDQPERHVDRPRRNHKVVIDGDAEPHEFDLAVRNGELRTAALALSFARQTPQDIQRDYQSAAWAIEDVRKRTRDLDLTVLVAPPLSGTSRTYQQARHVFDRLGTRTVVTDDIDQWADEVAHALAGNGAGRML
jgi:hypothetical protein